MEKIVTNNSLTPNPAIQATRATPRAAVTCLSAMLTLVALRLLMGARDVLDIWRKVARLSQSQSSENRNRQKRDASAWQEECHRHQRTKAAQNLALTRSALLAIIPFEPCQPLAQFLELYHRHPTKALQLILHSRAIL
jgi:hypothetical protein